MNPLRRVISTLATAVTVCGLVAGLTTPAAHAAPDFYTAPPGFDTTPGAVLATKVSALPVGSRGKGSATTVLYTSRQVDGTPVAVSGTYYVPTVRWQGRNAQPTVVVGAGTVGQGDQCAPSRAPGRQAPVLDLLDRGFRVFQTDYIGLGTPGEHTYLNRIEQGNAMIDGARAALRVGNTGPRTPIAFWGYSQGGAASGAAIELVAARAPELDVKGAYVGAPPADLSVVLATVDGTAQVGTLGYALNGFAARYPAVKALLQTAVDADGTRALTALSTQCVAESVARYRYTKSSKWTTSGLSLPAVLALDPGARDVLEQQRLGGARPAAPVLVESAVDDDLVPHAQVTALVARWRASGASVTYREDKGSRLSVPGSGAAHTAPLRSNAGPAGDFLTGLFDAG